MPITGNYLFIVAMDVTAEKEALFNEVYDTEHVPLLLKVPGVDETTRDLVAARHRLKKKDWDKKSGFAL